MKRTSAYHHEMAWRHAIRKRRIAREVYPESPGWEYYPNLHQFSKNKIHCSCSCCSTKTRNKGRRNRGNYDRSINYKRSDMVKVIQMDEDEYETIGRRHRRRRRRW